MLRGPELFALLGVVTAGGVASIFFSKHSPFNKWALLAKKFATTEHPPRMDFRWESLRVGLVSYRRCIRMAILDKGLYLAVMFPFGIWQKSLLIPWDQFKKPALENNSLLRYQWVRYVHRLNVGDPYITAIWFTRKAYDHIATKIGNP